MSSVDVAALERVLTSIDVRVGAVRRIQLDAGRQMPLALGVATMIYVVEGSARVESAGALECAVDFDRRSLVEGDALVTLGRRPVTLQPDIGTSVMIAELELAEAATRLTAVLPEFVAVTDFAGIEPAAAALALNMGRHDPDAGTRRSGDPVICRMMATTVLLSVIRAWAEAGCAPAGWPARSHDPFLERVIAAIHDEPGREWTVEMLAGVGAMSRSVFAERFRISFGRSPADYVAQVRMEEARRMLEAGQSVSAISRTLGYASDEGFSRAFRRVTGVTPSAWRMARPDLISA